MFKQRGWPLGCLGLMVLAVAARAAPPDPDADARALAAIIDRHLDAGHQKAKVTPAPLADDAEFLRRIYLQLAGRIPSVSEARTFLADTAPDKREKRIQRLLQSPRYVTHFTAVWRDWMLPEANVSFQTRFLIPGFENWLSGHLRENTPYDKMVHELLTTPVSGGRGRGIVLYGGGGQANPAAYYQAKEFKPENLAASTSRLFLGFRLECAQCHDHPFASWRREQFWEYAAFFSGIQSRRQGDFAVPQTETPAKREITIPGKDKVVQARFPDGTQPKWGKGDNTRKTLADWLTAADNPYFARATVNRLWEHFFGYGLVEPVDEMVGAGNVPSHPELLNELARQFAAHDFDLKFLIRAITLSKAYQRGSVTTDKALDDPRLFARMPLRGMTPEQLFDSIAEATGYQEGGGGAQSRLVIRGRGSPRAEFLSRFGDQPAKATEYQTTILQALSLMNGSLVESATSLQSSVLLLGVTDIPFMDTRERIETLYLATLSRMPKSKEMERLVKYVDGGGASGFAEGDTAATRQKKYNEALADVFWALLNSGEFVLNH